MPTRVENIKDNLVVQVKKLYRECNEKSFETRARYRDATERFCGFLAKEYGLQKFANIRDKHLIAYADYLKSEGIAVNTILSDLSGIRFFHRLSGAKFELPNNKTLNLSKREIGKEDRSWSVTEISRALQLADKLGRTDISYAIKISYLFGARIEEACKMRVEHIQKAIETGELYIKGKGGQERYVIMRTLYQHGLLNELISMVKARKLQPNDYLITDNVKGGVQREIKSIQNWLSNHSNRFKDADRTKAPLPGYKPKSEALTFHGLRYTFIQNLYDLLVSQGDPKAEEKTMEKAGHHRPLMRKIYSNRVIQ